MTLLQAWPLPSAGATRPCGSPRVLRTRSGYDASMSESDHEPTTGNSTGDAERDLAEHERPDVGLIGDEDLPEDLRPTDDNPLAKAPGEDEDEKDSSTGKVGGMPDMGDPGAPA